MVGPSPKAGATKPTTASSRAVTLTPNSGWVQVWTIDVASSTTWTLPTKPPTATTGAQRRTPSASPTDTMSVVPSVCCVWCSTSPATWWTGMRDRRPSMDRRRRFSCSRLCTRPATATAESRSAMNSAKSRRRVRASLVCSWRPRKGASSVCRNPEATGSVYCGGESWAATDSAKQARNAIVSRRDE